MDHAISGLSYWFQSAINLHYDMGSTRDVVREEFKAYVDALNVLENYCYGEPVTDLETILNGFPTKK